MIKIPSLIWLLPVFFLHIIFRDVKPEHLRNEKLFRANVHWKMFQHIQCLIHARALPPNFPWQSILKKHQCYPEQDFDTLTAEHVPDPQHGGPGQCPSKQAQEPLSHV